MIPIEQDRTICVIRIPVFRDKEHLKDLAGWKVPNRRSGNWKTLACDWI